MTDIVAKDVCNKHINLVSWKFLVAQKCYRCVCYFRIYRHALSHLVAQSSSKYEVCVSTFSCCCYCLQQKVDEDRRMQQEILKQKQEQVTSFKGLVLEIIALSSDSINEIEVYKKLSISVICIVPMSLPDGVTIRALDL